MPMAALVGLGVYASLAFGLRGWVHVRRTGSAGFRGLSGEVGSLEWMGGVLFIVAVVAATVAPIAELAGVLRPLVPPAGAWGGALVGLGLAGTLWAQFSMGDSWRIGVDESETTRLVAHGPFRWVRNPIFTSMLVAMCGFALLTPNVVAVLALLSLVVGLELHVRHVEEPYLLRTHAAPYRAYAARTGRFVPGVGRLGGMA